MFLSFSPRQKTTAHPAIAQESKVDIGQKGENACSKMYKLIIVEAAIFCKKNQTGRHSVILLFILLHNV
jgi:hypothetical protein